MATVILATAIGWSGMASAQELIFRGNRAQAPSVEQYMKQAGPQTKAVPHGALKIDGQQVNCGTRPTVLNPKFDSWGGAFPGFVILNTTRIQGLSTQVKLYIYSHECGHQFIGASETKADLFAIRRGVRWGWLDAQGMEEICTFISKLKGDAVHPPGPQRCKTMRAYYRELVHGTQRASSGMNPHTLGPAN
ncbi:hypothetical protein AUC68_15085 [Methyloceanibacter methanicus]|uniref:Uncharacterized protein n=1 Tax=Methyloceanibacter methanicus TaxID=1774968 RepID=A0A1E3W633_9HYPH|nr:hypothetical protein [Methyloceanibacter methanicus]ODS00567.1 hypothetical protein AUC68_15085 [Methyloceanibacter methanicus]